MPAPRRADAQNGRAETDRRRRKGQSSPSAPRSLFRIAQSCSTIEYGRTFTDAFGSELSEADLKAIVLGHQAGVSAARRQANRLLIEDTDPILTAVWSDMLFGRRADWLNDDFEVADPYLLLDPSPPWTDDGTRYFPDAGARRRFHQLCHDELVRRGASFVAIGGSDWADREAAAVTAIVKAFPSLGA